MVSVFMFLVALGGAAAATPLLYTSNQATGRQPQFDNFEYHVRVLPMHYDTFPTGMEIRVELSVHGLTWNTTLGMANKWQLLNLSYNEAGLRMISAYIGGGTKHNGEWGGLINTCTTTSDSDVISERTDLIDATGVDPDSMSFAGYATFSVPSIPWRLCYRKSVSRFNITGEDEWGGADFAWLPPDRQRKYAWQVPTTGGGFHFPNTTDVYWQSNGALYAGNFVAIQIHAGTSFTNLFQLKPAARHMENEWASDIAKLVPEGKNCVDDDLVPPLGRYPGTSLEMVSQKGAVAAVGYRGAAMHAVPGTFSPSMGTREANPWHRTTGISYWTTSVDVVPVLYIRLPPANETKRYHLCFSSMDERKFLRTPAADQSPGWRKVAKEGSQSDLVLEVVPHGVGKVEWDMADRTPSSWGVMQFTSSSPLNSHPSKGEAHLSGGDAFRIVPQATFTSLPFALYVRDLLPPYGCSAPVEHNGLGSFDLGGTPRKPSGWKEDATGDTTWGYFVVPTTPAKICYRREGGDWAVVGTLLPTSTSTNITYWVNDTRAGTWAPLIVADEEGRPSLLPVENTWLKGNTSVDPASVAFKLVKAGGNCMKDAGVPEHWDLSPFNPPGHTSQLTVWIVLPPHEPPGGDAKGKGWYVCFKLGEMNWVRLRNPKFAENIYGQATVHPFNYFTQEYPDQLRTSPSPQITVTFPDQRGGTDCNLTVDARDHLYPSDRYAVVRKETACWEVLHTWQVASAWSYRLHLVTYAQAALQFTVPDTVTAYSICYFPSFSSNIVQAAIRRSQAGDSNATFVPLRPLQLAADLDGGVGGEVVPVSFRVRPDAVIRPTAADKMGFTRTGCIGGVFEGVTRHDAVQFPLVTHPTLFTLCYTMNSTSNPHRVLSRLVRPSGLFFEPSTAPAHGAVVVKLSGSAHSVHLTAQSVKLVPYGALCSDTVSLAHFFGPTPVDITYPAEVHWAVRLPSEGRYTVCFKPKGHQWIAVPAASGAVFLDVQPTGVKNARLTTSICNATDVPEAVVGGATFPQGVLVVHGTGLDPQFDAFKFIPAQRPCTDPPQLTGAALLKPEGSGGAVSVVVAAPVWEGGYTMCYRRGAVWVEVGWVAVVRSFLRFTWSISQRYLTVVDDWAEGATPRPSLWAAEDKVKVLPFDIFPCAEGPGAALPVSPLVSGAGNSSALRRKLLDEDWNNATHNVATFAVCYRFGKQARGRVQSGVWVVVPDVGPTRYPRESMLPVLQPYPAFMVTASLISNSSAVVGDIYKFAFEVFTETPYRRAVDHSPMVVSAVLSVPSAQSSAWCREPQLYNWDFTDRVTVNIEYGTGTAWFQPLAPCSKCELHIVANRIDTLSTPRLWRTASATVDVAPVQPVVFKPVPSVARNGTLYKEGYNGKWFTVEGFAAGPAGAPAGSAAGGWRAVVSIELHTDADILSRTTPHCNGTWTPCTQISRYNFSTLLSPTGWLSARVALSTRMAIDTVPTPTIAIVVSIAVDTLPVAHLPVVLRPIFAERMLITAIRPVKAGEPSWLSSNGYNKSALQGDHRTPFVGGTQYAVNLTLTNKYGMLVPLDEIRPHTGFRSFTVTLKSTTASVELLEVAAVPAVDDSGVEAVGTIGCVFEVRGRCSGECTLVFSSMRKLNATITSPIRAVGTTLRPLEKPPEPLRVQSATGDVGTWVIESVSPHGFVDEYDHSTLFVYIDSPQQRRDLVLLSPTTPLPVSPNITALRGGRATIPVRLAVPCFRCRAVFISTSGSTYRTAPFDVIHAADHVLCSVVSPPNPTPGVSVSVHVQAVTSDGGNESTASNAFTVGGVQGRLDRGRGNATVKVPSGCTMCTYTVEVVGDATWTPKGGKGQCTTSPLKVSTVPKAAALRIAGVRGAEDVIEGDGVSGTWWVEGVAGGTVEVVVQAVDDFGVVDTGYIGSSKVVYPVLAAAPEVGAVATEGNGRGLVTSPPNATRYGVTFAEGTAVVGVGLQGACLKCRIRLVDPSKVLREAWFFVTVRAVGVALRLVDTHLPTSPSHALPAWLHGPNPWIAFTAEVVDPNGVVDYTTNASVLMELVMGMGVQQWKWHSSLSSPSATPVSATGATDSVVRRVDQVTKGLRGGARFHVAGVRESTAVGRGTAFYDMWGHIKVSTVSPNFKGGRIASFTVENPTYWQHAREPRRIVVTSHKEAVPSEHTNLYEAGYASRGVVEWSFPPLDLTPAAAFPVRVQAVDVKGYPVWGAHGTVSVRVQVVPGCGGSPLAGHTEGELVDGNVTLWLSFPSPCQHCSLHFVVSPTTFTLPSPLLTIITPPLTIPTRNPTHVLHTNSPAVPHLVAPGEGIILKLSLVFLVSRVFPVELPPSFPCTVAIRLVPIEGFRGRDGGCLSALNAVGAVVVPHPVCTTLVVSLSSSSSELHLSFSRACEACELHLIPFAPLDPSPITIRNKAGRVFVVTGAATHAVALTSPPSIPTPREEGVVVVRELRDTNDDPAQGEANFTASVWGDVRGVVVLREIGSTPSVQAYVLYFSHPCRECWVSWGTESLRFSVSANSTRLAVTVSEDVFPLNSTHHLQICVRAVDDLAVPDYSVGGDTTLYPGAPSAAVSASAMTPVGEALVPLAAQNDVVNGEGCFNFSARLPFDGTVVVEVAGRQGKTPLTILPLPSDPLRLEVVFPVEATVAIPFALTGTLHPAASPYFVCRVPLLSLSAPGCLYNITPTASGALPTVLFTKSSLATDTPPLTYCALNASSDGMTWDSGRVSVRYVRGTHVAPVIPLHAVTTHPHRITLFATDSTGEAASESLGDVVATFRPVAGGGCVGAKAVTLTLPTGSRIVTAAMAYSSPGTCVVQVEVTGATLRGKDSYSVTVQSPFSFRTRTSPPRMVAGQWASFGVDILDPDGAVVEGDNFTTIRPLVNGCGWHYTWRSAPCTLGTCTVDIKMGSTGEGCRVIFAATGLLTSYSPPFDVVAQATRLRLRSPLLGVTGHPVALAVEAVDNISLAFPDAAPNRQSDYDSVAIVTSIPEALSPEGCVMCRGAVVLRNGSGVVVLPPDNSTIRNFTVSADGLTAVQGEVVWRRVSALRVVNTSHTVVAGMPWWVTVETLMSDSTTHTGDSISQINVTALSPPEGVVFPSNTSRANGGVAVVQLTANATSHGSWEVTFRVEATTAVATEYTALLLSPPPLPPAPIPHEGYPPPATAFRIALYSFGGFNATTFSSGVAATLAPVAGITATNVTVLSACQWLSPLDCRNVSLSTRVHPLQDTTSTTLPSLYDVQFAVAVDPSQPVSLDWSFASALDRSLVHGPLSQTFLPASTVQVLAPRSPSTPSPPSSPSPDPTPSLTLHPPISSLRDVTLTHTVRVVPPQSSVSGEGNADEGGSTFVVAALPLLLPFLLHI